MIKYVVIFVFLAIISLCLVYILYRHGCSVLVCVVPILAASVFITIVVVGVSHIYRYKDGIYISEISEVDSNAAYDKYEWDTGVGFLGYIHFLVNPEKIFLKHAKLRENTGVAVLLPGDYTVWDTGAAAPDDYFAYEVYLRQGNNWFEVSDYVEGGSNLDDSLAYEVVYSISDCRVVSNVWDTHTVYTKTTVRQK